MRTPILPPLMLVILAVALYLAPAGSFYSWKLFLRGTVARLHKAPDPIPGAGADYSFNRELLGLLAQRDAEIADLHRRLRDLSATVEYVDRARVVPARIVRLGPDDSLDSFTIDAGLDDALAPGQAVVVGGALVGVVARCEANASLVLSLASPGCYLSTRLGEPEGSPARPRALTAVRGAGAGRVRIVSFNSDTAAREGWLAMTSGLEKSIPEGLMVGTVAGRFADGSESGTLEAELRPAVDLTSLDYVAVIARED